MHECVYEKVMGAGPEPQLFVREVLAAEGERSRVHVGRGHVSVGVPLNEQPPNPLVGDDRTRDSSECPEFVDTGGSLSSSLPNWWMGGTIVWSVESSRWVLSRPCLHTQTSEGLFLETSLFTGTQHCLNYTRHLDCQLRARDSGPLISEPALLPA